MAKTDFKSVSEYIAAQPKPAQSTLKRLQKVIREAVPDAQEGISYQIPAYKLYDRPVIYFAGWKEHFSIYPAGDRLVEAFKKDLARYKRTKGTIRFPMSEPLPGELISAIAKFRAKEVTERYKPKATAGKKSRSSGETQLERVRRICFGIPNVSEKVSHGMPAFFVQTGKGVFARFVENHHGDGHLAVWLAAQPALQAALIEEASGTYFKPPYVGSSGWIGVELNRIDDRALEIHIREAWALIAQKKK